MIVFIDTNVLISSFINIESTPFKAIAKTFFFPYFGVTSDYCLEEFYSVIEYKFPNREQEMKKRLLEYLPMLNLITTSNDAYDIEQQLRDYKDRLVLRAALQIDADIMITGDKDLLDLSITKPKIITPREFVNNY